VNKEKLMNLAALLSELAEGIKAICEDEKAELEQETKEEPKQETKEEAKQETKEAKQESGKYTLEDVRKKLAEKSSAGFTAEVRELLNRHGAAKLSLIKESEYAAIMKEAEGIG